MDGTKRPVPHQSINGDEDHRTDHDVENKPGGGGTVFLAEYVAKDNEDPYKLFVSSPPILINNLKRREQSIWLQRRDTARPNDQRLWSDCRTGKLQIYRSAIADRRVKADPTSVTLAGGSAPLDGPLDQRSACIQIRRGSENR